MVDGVCRTRAHLKFLKGELYIAISLSRFKLIRSDRTVVANLVSRSVMQCRAALGEAKEK
jgi:hypothetical protein